MRIVDTNQSANTSAVQSTRTDSTRAVNPSGSDNPHGGKVAQNADSVELSGLSGQVSQSLQADSASRAHKVEQLTAAVQAGTYHLNAKAVSHAIVNHAISGGGDVDGDGDNK